MSQPAFSVLAHPRLVVLEGLDGSGKTTLCNTLQTELGAQLVINPPRCRKAARAQADALPEAEKRAWYLESNSLAIHEAEAHLASGHWVVMDRSIASTLAFGRAHLGHPASLEVVPEGAVLPHFYLLLISEEERQRRAGSRQLAQTREERQLIDSPSFRQLVLQGYLQLRGVPLLAEGAPEDIARNLLKLHQLLVPGGLR